jgi:DNA/RNA non-specific endonuclease
MSDLKGKNFNEKLCVISFRSRNLSVSKSTRNKDQKSGLYFEFIDTTLKPDYLGMPRSDVTKAVKKALGEIGTDYHYGHVIASALGGSGGDLKNVFPQMASVNQGNYKSMETFIRGLLEGKSEEKGYIKMRVSLFFVASKSAEKTPDAVAVQLIIYDAGHNFKQKYGEYFNNKSDTRNLEVEVNKCIQTYAPPWTNVEVQRIPFKN